MKISYTSLFLTSTALASIVPASGAFAQDGATGDRIVVTGSRIVRDGSTAPTPVTAVQAQVLEQSAPSNLPDALNKLPQFNNSDSAATGATFRAGQNLSGNYLNLRSLGSPRLLVLVDGQRMTPTNQSNAVDLNLLPQMLVERVDVVTGGVSAVYGSDAVTGVVNFVLDTDFEGVKGVAQAGVSSYGDAFSHRYGVAAGTSIGDRIHVVGSYNHYDNNGVGSLYDRPWSHDAPTFTGAGTTSSPIRETPNPRFLYISDGGAIDGGIFDEMTFRPDGTLRDFIHGLPSGRSIVEIGGDGVKFGNEESGTQSLIGALETDRVFGRVGIDLTDSIEFYAQGMWGRSFIFANSAPPNQRSGTSSRRLTIFADNPFLLPEIAQALDDAGEESFVLSKMMNDQGTTNQRIESDFYMLSTGLNGEIPDTSWTWGISFAKGRSEYNLASYEFNSQRMYAAIDAVRDPDTGNIVCGVTLRNPGFLDDCQPMNVIGFDNFSQESKDFAWGDSTSRIINEMEYVNVGIQGELFDLPAGPVSVAFGGEYRTQSLDQTSNSNPFALDDPDVRADYFEGIRGVSPTAAIWQVTNIGLASGTQEVKEVYGEVLIPVFQGATFAEDLNLNLAGRMTDYKTSGTVWTYKLGGSWTPVDGFRIRASYSRDIRAPSLFELFSEGRVVQSGITDPHTNFTSVLLTQSGGNENLDPEFGKTLTVGFVLQPNAVPGLTAIVDAYSIKIDGAIRTTNAVDQLNICEASNGTDPVCDLIERPLPYSDRTPANFPIRILNVPLNLASLETRGVDVEVGYTFSLDDLIPAIGGDLDLRAYVTYLDSYTTQGDSSSPVVERAGYEDENGLPKWSGMLRQTLSTGRFSAAFSERFTGSYRQDLDTIYSPESLAIAPNQVYVDVNLAYQLGANDEAELFFNVQNLFDNEPPLTNESSSGANLVAPTNRSMYDAMGRYLTGGVRVRF